MNIEDFIFKIHQGNLQKMRVVKDVFMQFLLHLNEDFDDDLLLESITYLTE